MMKTTFTPYGDRALLIQWEQQIDPAINADVVALDRAITKAGIRGVLFSIPAYCSLTVGFDPKQIDYKTLCADINELISGTSEEPATVTTSRQLTIPVCYEAAYAPDLDWLCQNTGLEKEQVIHIHTNTIFRVYMLGFMPGFPYLGKLPRVLETPRKTSPRIRVPAGAVALAGLQTGIYPIESPGGWQIIGQTPWKIFDPERKVPFLLQAGDEVKFRSIDEKTFNKLKK